MPFDTGERPERDDEPPWKIEATIRIRRGPGWKVKPSAEAQDGRRFRFFRGREIEPDESSIYVGETRWIPADLSYPATAPTWVASGDLVDVRAVW